MIVTMALFSSEVETPHRPEPHAHTQIRGMANKFQSRDGGTFTIYSSREIALFIGEG